MQIEMPFFDTPESALRACIEALGGAKKVGSQLFPDKTMENGRDYLLACVNPDRQEKLSISQIIFILHSAKNAGFHTAFFWIANECEYDSKPITKAEEIDRLTSVIEQSSKTLESAIKTLANLKGI